MPPDTTSPPTPEANQPQSTPVPDAQTPEMALPSTPPPTSKPPKSMAKMALVGILVLLLILVVVAVITRPKSKTITVTKTTTAKVQTAAVTVTSTGFNPQTIKVKAGTQITWTNNDTAVHQVAADPYPKDDSIPGFNSTVILQKGDTTSFIFTKAGTYTYHDERDPLKTTGTVVVE